MSERLLRWLADRLYNNSRPGSNADMLGWWIEERPKPLSQAPDQGE